MKAPGWDALSLRSRKLARWILGLLLLYALAGFLILPPIVRFVAVKKLSQQLHRKVAIQTVRLNPFVLSATVRGLLISDPDGQPFVSWDEVYVNFQIASLFGHPWVFKEVSTTKPRLRVQVNRDYSFNFSDLVANASTNAPPKEPPRPLALRIDRLHIGGASASLTDLTTRTPFKRVLGPLDVTLVNFRTDPDNKNPYSFAGTTDAGEEFAWSGFFFLSPLRSQGEFALENIALNKYAPLYQDFVRFQIKDGIVDLRSTYRFELSSSNRVASVTNASFNLHSFKLAGPDGEANIVELPEFSVTGASVDATARTAEAASITASGGTLALQRNKDAAVNVVELSKPAAGTANASGAVLLLLRSVTNAVAMLLNSTNTWTGTIHDVNFQDCALNLEDLANSRPVRLNLDQITFSAKHISNVPGTNLVASLSLRWNTNGTIKTGVEASFSPPTADVRLALDNLELRPLDPYLESRLNVFILGSKLGMDGRIHLRTPKDQLPEVTFQGDVRLDDFATVDGVLAEDLLKWGSVRITGIDANLNPPSVAVKEVAVDDACARVIIETNRTINLLAALRLIDTNAPAPAAAGEPSGKARDRKDTDITQVAVAPAAHAPDSASLPKISVATVVISNAQIRFTDRSLSPNVNLAVQQLGGTVAGLSSDELQHADVNLHASVDNVGPVEITGTLNPLSPNQTNDIKIAVKNVDLTPTSPYAGKFAGYRLAKGKLQMNLDYRLSGRNLKAQNLIVLDQFTFGEKVSSPDATQLPVRLAVAILKDRSGRIELDVPIEGSLDDPQFRLGKVITRAVLNLITRIVTSPFAALGAIFGGKGEEISYQDFTPGSSEILPANREKLDVLVKGLYERPGLQLEIAGSVDPDADRAGLRRVGLDKELRSRKWMSLRKSERTTTTPGQITLTPEERTSLVRKAYDEALSKGEIDLAKLSSNTNTAALAVLLQPRPRKTDRGAVELMQPFESPPAPPVTAGGNSPHSDVTETTDPKEQVLLTTIAVTDSDLETLAAERAKAVREYILQSGKVEAGRLFLTESQPGAVKTDGSRVYLQLQ